MIDCLKLDSVDYTDKLTQIITDNNIKGLIIVRMEVPGCGGLEFATKRALQDSEIHLMAKYCPRTPVQS